MRFNNGPFLIVCLLLMGCPKTPDSAAPVPKPPKETPTKDKPADLKKDLKEETEEFLVALVKWDVRKWTGEFGKLSEDLQESIAGHLVSQAIMDGEEAEPAGEPEGEQDLPKYVEAITLLFKERLMPQKPGLELMALQSLHAGFEGKFDLWRVGPTSRFSHAMAYDPTVGHVLMFNGASLKDFYNDLWGWDGTNWTQK